MVKEFWSSTRRIRIFAILVIYLCFDCSLALADNFLPPFPEPSRSVDPFEHFGIQDSPYRHYNLRAHEIEGAFEDDFTMAVAKHALAEARVFVVVHMYIGAGTTTDNNCEMTFQVVTHLAVQILDVSDILLHKNRSATWIDTSEQAAVKFPDQGEFSIVPTETFAVPLVRYLSPCRSARDSTQQIEDDWNALRRRYARHFRASLVLNRVKGMLNAATLEVLSNE